jgi:hypothetical protein
MNQCKKRFGEARILPRVSEFAIRNVIEDVLALKELRHQLSRAPLVVIITDLLMENIVGLM